LQLAERWTAAGHPTFVLTRERPGCPTVETHRGVEIRREIRPWSAGPLFGLTFLMSLRRLLKKYAAEYDVVLAGQAPWEAVVTGALRLRGGRPTVARIASTGPWGDVTQLRAAKGAWLWKKWFRGNDRFLAPSPQVREELLAIGAPDASIAPMTNGVDTARFCPAGAPDPDAARTLLFAGRLTLAKNPWGAVRAFERIDRSRGAQLLFAGDGPLRTELEAWVRERSLRERVEFLGECADMPAVYRRAGIVLQTSPNEGCSNALLEAMSCGLCPAATNVAGNRDLIRNGETGLLTPFGDEAAAAAACERLLSDGELRRSMGNAAREYVLRAHDLDEIAGKYLTMFGELVQARRAAPK
jgi:glycosyltransferase involved in cell wall biosynthesis